MPARFFPEIQQRYVVNVPEIRNNKLIILMPVYNDWGALSLLLPLLDQQLKNAGHKVEILLVDDGSTTNPLKDFAKPFDAIITIDVLSLKRNLGHQRAIAVGLSYIEANQPGASVIIMDSDGEDDPKDVPRLIRACAANSGEKIVFAARTKRSEGAAFTFFYHLYRFIHFLLIGIRVRVGNFSIVPPHALKRLVAVSELWNHYAAAVHKAKLPMELIPSERSRRLEGSPRMDMVSLVVHGLSAMAVFGDRIGVRLLIIVSIGMSLTVAALAIVVGIRLATDFAIPGWATYAAGLLFVMLIQMLLVILVFVFVILAARNAANVLSTNDHVQFIGSRHRIYG
jgi:polyisoprenyl-phosphate glycosyltransferase